MSFTRADIELVACWQQDPLSFVKFMWPQLGQRYNPKTGEGLSKQQEEGLVELGKLIRGKLYLAWGRELTEEENYYSKKIGLSIQSGNGTGKDFLAAIIAIYFTTCFPFSKNSATANTSKQLHNVLWSEIAKLMRLARKRKPEDKETMLESLLELQKEKLFLKELKGKEQFCEAVTVDTKQSGDEQAQGIAGRHEDYQVFLVDEGSNIADPVFQKIERTLTRVLNLIIIIFNAVRSQGYAIDSQTDSRFISLRWNAEESEMVTKEHIENMAKYGRDSNSYRVGVLGLPPLTDVNTLIPWEWLEDACERDYEPVSSDPVVKAMDCGGGGDPSLIATRKGWKFYSFKRNNSPDSNIVEDWACVNIMQEKPDVFFVDKNGLGHHIYNRIRKRMGSFVKPIMSQERADEEEKFTNKRAEMFYNLRTAFEDKNISLASLKDEEKKEIKKQLGAIKMLRDNRNRILIVKKEKIKKELTGDARLEESDTMAATFARKEDFILAYKNPHEDDEHEGRKVKREEERKETTWMSV